MKKILLILACLKFSMALTAQNLFFSPTAGEVINQNALMVSDSAVYLCMQKANGSTGLFYLKNNVASEVKQLGTAIQGVQNFLGSTAGKAYFTFGKKAMFVITDNSNKQKIWITDGTAAGTDTLRSLVSGDILYIAGMIGNDLYYTITSSEATAPLYSKSLIYKTNFTTAGTVLIRQIPASNLFENYIDSGVFYVYGYKTNGSFRALYSVLTDTTRLHTQSYVGATKVLNNKLYISDNSTGLTKKDLSTNTTVTITSSGNLKYPRVIAEINGKVIIQANTNLNAPYDARLYVSDGTAGNIVQLQTATAASVTLLENTYAISKNVVYFIGRNASWHYSLFCTDGSSANTRLVQELDNTTLAISYPRFRMCGDRLYYYSNRYFAGKTMYNNYTLSTCNPAADSLTAVSLNAGAGADIINYENYLDKIIYSTSNPLNQIYAINACSSLPQLVNGVNETSLESNFTVFPNPATSYLNIQSKNISNHSLKVEVFNTMAQQVYSSTVETGSTTVNVSNLPKGIYFIKVSDGQQTGLKKFLIQ